VIVWGGKIEIVWRNSVSRPLAFDCFAMHIGAAPTADNHTNIKDARWTALKF
jgi:hypothetical protein